MRCLPAPPGRGEPHRPWDQHQQLQADFEVVLQFFRLLRELEPPVDGTAGPESAISSWPHLEFVLTSLKLAFADSSPSYFRLDGLSCPVAGRR